MRPKKISRLLAFTLCLSMMLGNVFMVSAAETNTPSPAVLNQATGSYARRSRLSGINAIIYDELSKEIKKVADGKSASSTFSINISLKSILGNKWKTNGIYTASDLKLSSFNNNTELINAVKKLFNYNPSQAIDSLIGDMPYELYWFDKTSKWKTKSLISYCQIKTTSDGTSSVTTLIIPETAALEFTFPVISSYSKDGKKGTTAVNTTKTSGVKNALNLADSVVAANKSKSDYEKIKAYKEKICSLVAYDYAAARGSDYTDSFQMINVFDGNTNTNVVCEGYAKAFKYLCDKTTFSNKTINCQVVTGTMKGGTGAGPHMWNIVHMDDGKNYIVDVTNCDSGTIGSPNKLFLVGGTKTGSTYKSNNVNVNYTYDSDTLSQFSTSELTISASDYKGSSGDSSDEENEKVTVTLDGCGVTLIYKSKRVTVGEKYGYLPSPYRSGYTFAGWFTAKTESAGKRITESTICTTAVDHTLYAVWKADSSSTSGTSDSTGGSSSASGSAAGGQDSSSGNSKYPEGASEANKRARDGKGNVSKVKIIIDGMELTIDKGKVSIKKAPAGVGSPATYTVFNKNQLKLNKLLASSKSITIPAKISSGNTTYRVTQIGRDALRNNKKMTTLTVPSSLKKIEKGALSGTSKLKTVKITGGTKKTFNKIVRMLKSAGCSKNCKFVHVK